MIRNKNNRAVQSSIRKFLLKFRYSATVVVIVVVVVVVCHGLIVLCIEKAIVVVAITHTTLSTRLDVIRDEVVHQRRLIVTMTSEWCHYVTITTN